MYRCLSLVMLLFVMNACKSSNEEIAGSGDAAKIEVSWQMISNFIEPAQQMEAKFIFTNNGSFTLGDSAWSLFFNNTPRGIRPSPGPQPAKVEHINGDWYKLTPNKGFSLKPGETIEVIYRCDDFVIKETDAPQGLYFVFYEGGKEKTIVDLGDAKVLPFTTREQQLRGKGDREQVYSSALEYERNKALAEVTADQFLPVIPEPVKYTVGTGLFTINGSTVIYASAGLENEAGLLSEKLKSFTGISCKIVNTEGGSNAIKLTTGKLTVNNISKEAYRLSISNEGITISGADAAGVFYGTQSLLSLLPIEALSKKQDSVNLRTIQIEDAPRFAFRGLHLDVGRNFQTKETVLRVLDLLAFYKINQFLFYTTEDEGWRIAIEGLPELTEVGSQRAHQPGRESPALHPAYGSGSNPNSRGSHGTGYYSKDDFIDILRYAKARHIHIIPELNFPGHARAAIKSMEARYEKFSRAGKQTEAEEFRLIDPADTSVYLSAQGYKDNVVDVTRPSVYHFYEKVMDELAKMYTSAGLTMDVIHIGGDEVPSGAWKGSAAAQKIFANDNAMETYKNFHSYFTRNVLPLLKKRNLSVHAWEETALKYKKDGGYTVNPEFAGGKIVPYIWNNVYDPDLGYRMANAGYPVVLCNVTNFYFDLAYNNSPAEPGQYWAGFVDTRDAFTFDPYDMFHTTYTNAMGDPMVFKNVEKLKPASRKNILGVEAHLWSETIKGREMLEYDMLPKLFGYAQSAWCMSRPWENVEDSVQREKIVQSSWSLFAASISARDLPRLSYFNGGYNYRIPPPGVVVENGEVKANSSLPGLMIRYTTDGSDPVASSPLYTAPVKTTAKMKLRCFNSSGKAGKMVSL
jgi:hexosaminidase